MTRKLNAVLFLLLLAVAAPFYWLLLDSSTASGAVKSLRIEDLRALAVSLRGPLPIEVRTERIGHRLVPTDLLAAGGGLRPLPFVVRAFELVYPDGGLVTIDRGLGQAAAERYDLAHVNPAAQARVERAVANARVALTLEGSQRSRSKAVPEAQARDLPIEQPHAVAPGVVVIPADGVLPGQRMVYVRLADGHELIFAGDVAPVAQAWRDVRPPARLVTGYLHPRDREETAAWLRTLRALKEAAPQLGIVSGYDAVIPPIIKKHYVMNTVAAHAADR